MNYSLDELSPEIQDRIEAAVLDVFAKNNFHEASIRTVAKKARVSLSYIYKYYGNKEKLVLFFADKWLKELTGRMIDHLNGIEEPKEKLRKIFWLCLEFCERKIDEARIMFLNIPLNSWVRDESFKQEKYYKVLSDVLKDGQKSGVFNPDVHPSMLLDIINGILIRRFSMWFSRGEKESLTNDVNKLFEMVWQAISNSRK
ncbi:MAG: TetR/AcrR family transcriptional regulator [Thermodesulfobacteriota bacterium]